MARTTGDLGVERLLLTRFGGLSGYQNIGFLFICYSFDNALVSPYYVNGLVDVV